MGQLTVGLRRFLFLCAVVLVLPAIAAAQASVTLNTYQGPVGTEVTATGEGWPAGALVYAFINQQQVSFRPETVNEDGPAGAFAQKHTVLHNVLSDNRLHGHRTASQGHGSASSRSLRGSFEP